MVCLSTLLTNRGEGERPLPVQRPSGDEVAGYVRHKIACAGGAESIIDPAALSAVHSHSQGNPRVIDNLMTDALLLGAQLDKKVIDPELILAAVSGQNLM